MFKNLKKKIVLGSEQIAVWREQIAVCKKSTIKNSLSGLDNLRLQKKG